jgi:acetoin utilization protein AcuB
MQTLHVADAMNANVISISEEASLSDAIEQLRQNKISALVVVDHSGHMVGVISQTDLLRAWKESSGSSSVMHSPVSQYMTRDVVSVAPHKTLDYAMRTLNEHHSYRSYDAGRDFVTDRHCSCVNWQVRNGRGHRINDAGLSYNRLNKRGA